jgi:putative spermidine/putrescine transport system ATP-binding protein
MHSDWALRVGKAPESETVEAAGHMSGSKELVSFKGVSKSYDGVTVIVDDLELKILRGEFLTLLGPSGSGKTTTLTMLAGFENPDSGDIFLDGRAIDRLPPEKRNIGVVFQNYALFPHMSVAENVGFPLRVRKVAKAEIRDRVARALDMVRLSHLAERRPASLSGGQQQRVALARALIFEPELVLMDEPLGALDKQLREELQLEIKRIQRRLRLTILYVTHDQSEALTMSDRIAVFNKGRIQQLGVPDDIYNRPKTRFVATFIGDNNILDGAVEQIDGERASVRLRGGTLLRCALANAPPAASQVCVAIRPERIVVGDAARDAENAVSATVREVIYMGDEVRIISEFDAGCQMVVKIACTGSLCRPAVDSQIALGWSAEDCQIVTQD